MWEYDAILGRKIWLINDIHVDIFAAIARCDALRFLSVYTMALSCAFVLLFFIQDRLNASITELSWSWLKSTLLQNTCGNMMRVLEEKMLDE